MRHDDKENKDQLLSDYRDLLSVSDLMEIFTISKQTVYKELRSGKFGRPVMIGREYRVSRIYILENFFNANRQD